MVRMGTQPYSVGPTIFLDASFAPPDVPTSPNTIDGDPVPCITVVAPMHELFDLNPDTASITYSVHTDETTGLAEYDVQLGSLIATLPSIARMLTRQTASSIALPAASVDSVKLNVSYTINGIGGFSFGVNMTSLADAAGTQPLSTWLCLIADACARRRTLSVRQSGQQQRVLLQDQVISHAIVQGIHGLLNSAALQRQIIKSMATTYSMHEGLGTQTGVYNLRIADLAGIPFVFRINMHGLTFTTADGSVLSLQTAIPLRLVLANRVLIVPARLLDSCLAVWPYIPTPASRPAVSALHVFRFIKRFVCLPANLKDRHIDCLTCACAHRVTIRINNHVVYDADPAIQYSEPEEAGLDGAYPVIAPRNITSLTPPSSSSASLSTTLMVGENLLEVDVIVVSEEFEIGLSILAYNQLGQCTLCTDQSWVWASV